MIESSVPCHFRATKFPFLKSFSWSVCSMWSPCIMVLRIFFSIRSSSVPKMFMNLADDMLARSTVETWVIKAEKGEQGRATFIGDNLFIQLERQICQIKLTGFKIFACILKFAQKSGAQFNWKKIITKIIPKIITKVQFDFFIVTF